jgi:hypothetical protein
MLKGKVIILGFRVDRFHARQFATCRQTGGSSSDHDEEN